MMCTVDDDIDILWETDMLPTPLKTVYMFYLNWQTFIQTSIMCNVNILPINYIATSLVYTTSNFAYPPTTSTDTLKFQPQSSKQILKRLSTMHVLLQPTTTISLCFLFGFERTFSFLVIHLSFQHNYVFPSCNLSKVYKGLFLLLN